MTIASGSRVQLAIVEEVSFGTLPAVAMLPVRYKSSKLDYKLEGFTSEEVRADRQIRDFRLGMKGVDGSIDCEMAVGAHDPLYEGALAGVWTAGTSVSGCTTTSGNKIHRASGSFITDGYLIGDVLVVSGFGTSAHNGLARVAVVEAADLTMASSGTFGKTFVAGDSAGVVNLQGKRLKCGTTMKWYSIEQYFSDLVQYRLFKGCAVNEMSMKIQPKAIAEVSFTFLGQDTAAFQGSQFASSYSASPTGSPLDGFSGGLWEGGVASALVTGLDIKLANGRSVEGVLGSRVTPAIFEGRANITGTATVFFQDATAYNKFVNETESSIDILMVAPNGTDFLRVVVPACKFSSGNVEPKAEGPIPISMDFQSILATSGTAPANTTLYMQRSNT